MRHTKSVHIASLLALLLLTTLAGACGTPAPGGDIVVLSHYPYGRTSPVLAAIAKVENGEATTDADGVTRTSLEIGGRLMTLVEYPSHDRVVERLKDTANRPAAALLVVSGPDGLWNNQHGEQLRLAKEAGVPMAASFLGKVHLVDDQELLDLIESLDIQETLKQIGYTGVPTIRGSAVKALEDDPEGLASITELVAAMRQHAAPLLSAN